MTTRGKISTGCSILRIQHAERPTVPLDGFGAGDSSCLSVTNASDFDDSGRSEDLTYNLLRILLHIRLELLTIPLCLVFDAGWRSKAVQVKTLTTHSRDRIKAKQSLTSSLFE